MARQEFYTAHSSPDQARSGNAEASSNIFLRWWSQSGREFSRPLKTILIVFFLLTIFGISLHSAILTYNQLLADLDQQGQTAERFLLYHQDAASSGLEKALSGILVDKDFMSAVAAARPEPIVTKVRDLFEEMRHKHRISDLSVYGSDRRLLARAQSGQPDLKAPLSPLVAEAARSGSIATGLEFGKEGAPQLAVVRPLMDRQGHLIGLARIATEIQGSLQFVASALSSDLVMMMPTGPGRPQAHPTWHQSGSMALRPVTEDLSVTSSLFDFANDAVAQRGSTPDKSQTDSSLVLDQGRLKLMRAVWYPLADQSDPMGLLVVKDITSDIRAFTLRSLAALAAAGLFALATGILAFRMISNLQARVSASHLELETRVAAKTQALEASSRRLLEAQRITLLGSWERNLRTGEHHWSQEMYRIIGLPESLPPDMAYARLRELSDPAEAAGISKQLKRALSTCDAFDYKYRVIRPDGERRTLHVLGNVLAGADGKPEWIVGTTQDVTRQENALEHGQWLSDILEASLNEIYVVDASSLTFEYANTCALANLQYTMDDLAKLRLPEILADEEGRPDAIDVSPLLQDIGSLLRIKGLQRRKDGSVYPVETSIQAHKTGSHVKIVAICNDVSERVNREKETQRARQRAERLAYFDDLTGLPNRAACQRDALGRFSSDPSTLPSFLLHLDIDNFKRINDTLGHSAGDACLSQTGERLRLCCIGLGTAYRWGGDEFVIMAQGPTSEAQDLCARLQAAMRAPMDLNGDQIWPTISIGAARCPQDGASFDQLLVKADLALYNSKEKGKDRWTCFTEDLKDQSDKEAELELDLRRAIQEDEFFLVFQPQVNLRSHQVTGIEALVRWQHPTRGELSPGLFLPVVEKTNLAAPLGKMVIDKAVKAASTLNAMGLDFGRVAVNLSPAHLKSGTLVQDFNKAMALHGATPDMLTAEVLESVFLDDTGHNNAKLLQELYDLGLHVELDDFGTGFASLSHLADLPITGLKIDRSFTARLLIDEKKEIVINHLIHLARSLDINVVCEGVETDAQFERLRMMGNYSVQGYLIARPMKFQCLTSWLNSVQSDVGFTDL